MNENHSQFRVLGIRALCAALASALLLASSQAIALLHAEHSLRYRGWVGWKPVTVEVTLRARPGEVFEYREWVAPRWWAGFLGEPEAHQTLLRTEGTDLRPVAHDAFGGRRIALDGLDEGAVDLLLVRLEARGDIAAGNYPTEYAVWQEDGSLETWRLEVTGDETVETPDATYRALTFRLGNDEHWILGWSAPLLAFHFVRLEFWEDGHRVGSLDLEAKELWE